MRKFQKTDVMAENAQVRPSSGTAPPAKKARTEEETEDEADGMVQIMSDLETTQDNLNELNERASEEILRVEQHFNELRKPHFSRRSEIISKIPQFWMQALLSHPLISPVITEEDEEPLAHLLDIHVEEFQDIKSGYKIEFRFSENEHFTNVVLTKTYNLSTSNDHPTTTDHTPINWRENKCPLDRYNPRKRGTESFFMWYVEEVDVTGLGELIKDELWSDPVQYYMLQMVGSANDHGSENGDGEDDDDDERAPAAGYVFQNEDGTFVDEHGNPVEPYEDDEEDDDDEDDDAEYISSPEQDGYAYQQQQAGVVNAGSPVYITDGDDDDDDEDGEEDDGYEDAEQAEVVPGDVAEGDGAEDEDDEDDEDDVADDGDAAAAPIEYDEEEDDDEGDGDDADSAEGNEA